MSQFAQTAVGSQARCLTTTGVRIVALNDGQLIKASSKAGSKNGSIMLQEVSKYARKGYTETVKKTAFLRGEISELQEIIAEFAGKVMPGRLVVTELLEGTPEAQERLAEDLAYFKGDYARALGKKPKVNPSTGEYLTVNGTRIIRFVDYDMFGEEPDVFVAHDRAPKAPVVAPVIASAETVPTEPAQMPGDDGRLPF